MKPSLIITLLVGGVIGFTSGRMFSPQRPPPATRAAPVAPARDATVYKVTIDGAPTKGAADALVTLVEFSDYQCPFCARSHQTVQELEKLYGADLRVVMKQHPLDAIHPRARPAALAALAAGEQGKYWEMHDLLFENQGALEATDLEGYARKLGLDVDKWKDDQKLPKFEALIASDSAQALRFDSPATPSFFVNGQKIAGGARPLDVFKSAIDDALREAKAKVAAGTPRGQLYESIIAGGRGGAPPSPPAEAKRAEPMAQVVDIPADSPFTGPKFAKVTIVEWSDFECPFCAEVQKTLSRLEEKYKGSLRLVFRHQPLPIHPNAKLAAQAAVAASEQGKFWQMHDKLFSNQSKLDRASLDGYARAIGLDMKRFNAALATQKYVKRVEEDSAAALRLGATATPTFFINGREVQGAISLEAMSTIIDEEIVKANDLLAKGVKMDRLYAEMQKATAEKRNPPSAAMDIRSAPTKGPANAPVTIVEFSDFQCPYCSRAVPILAMVWAEYPGKIRLAFKNLPLPFHPNARPAATAALAAGAQGKFWEMHDKLFLNQTRLDRSSLESYAKDLHLNVTAFNAAMDSKKFDAQIDADIAEATRLGASGTPTFFINGRMVVGAQPIENFKSVIDEELKKANAK